MENVIPTSISHIYGRTLLIEEKHEQASSVLLKMHEKASWQPLV